MGASTCRHEPILTFRGRVWPLRKHISGGPAPSAPRRRTVRCPSGLNARARQRTRLDEPTSPSPVTPAPGPRLDADARLIGARCLGRAGATIRGRHRLDEAVAASGPLSWRGAGSGAGRAATPAARRTTRSTASTPVRINAMRSHGASSVSRIRVSAASVRSHSRHASARITCSARRAQGRRTPRSAPSATSDPQRRGRPARRKWAAISNRPSAAGIIRSTTPIPRRYPGRAPSERPAPPGRARRSAAPTELQSGVHRQRAREAGESDDAGIVWESARGQRGRGAESSACWSRAAVRAVWGWSSPSAFRRVR